MLAFISIAGAVLSAEIADDNTGATTTVVTVIANPH
jgi:hypothetical protein